MNTHYKKREEASSERKIVTFPVPHSIDEFKEKIIVYTKSFTDLSKKELINRIYKFHSEGNISEAKKNYQNFIDKGFTDPIVFSNFGILLKNLGNLKEAEIFERKAIQLNPNFAEAHHILGMILKNLENLKEAEKSIRKAIEINRNYAEAYNNLVTILIQLSKLEEAEILQRKAIKINPNSAVSNSNLGKILLKVGKLEEAEIILKKAIKLKPNNASNYINLGDLYSQDGRLEEARLATIKAIELNPNLERLHYHLGNIYKDLGQLKEAEKSTRQAIKIKANFAEAYFNLGNILESLGNRKEAITEWTKAVNLKPKLVKAIETLGLHLYLDKNYELALKYLSKSKSDLSLSLYLGCLLSLDRENEFKRKYQEVSERNITNAAIGGVIEHANIIYNNKYNSPFCNKAINYVMWDQINEELFPNNHLNQLIDYLETSIKEPRAQGLLTNGKQTSGNLFLLNFPFIKSIKKALELKIDNYKTKFRDSGQGFINKWPKYYELRSWMIGMKSGGFLKPHNHEYGWITGSFYLKIPKIDQNDDDNAGSISFSYSGPQYPTKGKIFNSTIKKVKTRDICIFPSSVFHHTITFQSDEERICFVFDLVQKK